MNLNALIYKVEDVMERDFLKFREDEKLKTVIDEMIGKNKDYGLVFKDEELKGIFTKTDLSKVKDIKSHFNSPVKEYMTRGVKWTETNIAVMLARDIMLGYKIGTLPVKHGNKVVGVLTGTIIRDSFYLKINELLNLQMNILDNIHEAICICDKVGKVFYFNKSAEKLYGIKSKEILDNNIQKFFINSMTIEVLKSKKGIENVKHEPKPGKVVILSTIPIFDTNGELIAVVSTDRDITEIESLNYKLRTATEEIERLNREVNSNYYQFPSVVGKSKGIIEAINLSEKIACSTASVLITGESGTGKEVFSKEIHNCSGRKGTFVAVNCSAIPENLFESELFGYVEGAFTGANKKGKKGLFEFADGGTLFLDEIGDMPMVMQTKLLRVLQDGIVYRLGSEKGIKVDTRIIAATNKDLKKAILNKEFREDLFYRLVVIQIKLPPLRERREDIKDLINHFIKVVTKKENINITKIDGEVYEILSRYKWEGNIRELKNIVQRMVILSTNGKIEKGSIPEYISKDVEEGQEKIIEIGDEFDLSEKIEALEKAIIEKAMKKVGGNKCKAAELLKIKRTTLYYKLKHYEIE